MRLQVTKKKKAPKRKPKRKPNWSGYGAALMSLLAALAALPYTLGDIATIIPSEWKPQVTGASLIAAFILRIANQTNASS